MNGGGEVIVATNAFGMGVDKADVRFVYHFDITDSLDSYSPGDRTRRTERRNRGSVLFYRAENMGIRKFQAGGGNLQKPSSRGRPRSSRSRADVPACTLEEKRRKQSVEAQGRQRLNRLQEVGAVETASGGRIQVIRATWIHRNGRRTGRGRAGTDEARKRNGSPRCSNMRKSRRAAASTCCIISAIHSRVHATTAITTADSDRARREPSRSVSVGRALRRVLHRKFLFFRFQSR